MTTGHGRWNQESRRGEEGESLMNEEPLLTGAQESLGLSDDAAKKNNEPSSSSHVRYQNHI